MGKNSFSFINCAAANNLYTSNKNGREKSVTKKTVTESILSPFGWETIDIGGIEGARLLKPLSILAITYFLKQTQEIMPSSY
jgi:hypothetical protein